MFGKICDISHSTSPEIGVCPVASSLNLKNNLTLGLRLGSTWVPAAKAGKSTLAVWPCPVTRHPETLYVRPHF